MSKAEPTFTLLTTCANPADASVLRSLLEANEILCVVQGEQHSGLLGPMMGGAIIEIRVLVATKDLEKARALLAAEVVPPEAGVTGAEAPTEEAVCPVHGERSTATCARCGTFLCAQCERQGTPPLCEDCADRNGTGHEAQRLRRRKIAGGLIMLFVLSPFLFLLLALLHQWLG